MVNRGVTHLKNCTVSPLSFNHRKVRKVFSELQRTLSLRARVCVCVSLYRTNINELVGVYFVQCCEAASLPLGRGTIDPPSVQQPEALSGNSLGGKLINHHCSARENFASLPLTVLLIFRQRETLRKAFAAGNGPRFRVFAPPPDVEAARTLSFKGSVAPLID